VGTIKILDFLLYNTCVKSILLNKHVRQEEKMDIKITDLALNKIKEFASFNKSEPNVRIYVTSTGCSGARFGIAIDDIRKEDEISDICGIKVITDKEYIPMYSDGLNIDYVLEPKEGFIITSLRTVKKSCGGCSTGGCSGSCGNK
jgi:iron-sulfur cluster assembly accessory protein